MSGAAAQTHAAVWSAGTVDDHMPQGDFATHLAAEFTEDGTRNRQASWEEAAPRNFERQQLQSSTATVRVSGEGRRVLPPDGFSQRAQALWEVGATRITVSVEYASPTPSYWCSCQVVDRRERFEAVASNALEAMEKVLRQIHAWRSAAAPTRR